MATKIDDRLTTRQCLAGRSRDRCRTRYRASFAGVPEVLGPQEFPFWATLLLTLALTRSMSQI